MSSRSKAEMDKLVAALNEDYPKFAGGTKAAATRVRNTLMSMSKLCKQMRAEVQEEKSKK